MWPQLILAVLKANAKIKKSPDSGRNRPETYDLPRKMAVRTLPRDPPGEGGVKNKKIKIILSTSNSCGCNLKSSEVRSGVNWVDLGPV